MDCAPSPSQQQQREWDASVTPRFQTLKFLGKGGQGFVQLAYDNLHKQRVAIKYIDRGWSRGFYKYVLRETLNHQQLSLCKHPHIVEFYEVFLTPSYLAVVMEYVHGTNLQHYLESAGAKLPEDVARFIFQQLVIAVDFCHKKGKVNRDIKLANILLQEGHLPLVKLCDFGFSKDKFDDSEPQTQIGTALFTAPEIFTNVPGQVYDAEAADVWSCGVVLFVMLFGCHPFLSVEDTQHRKHAQVIKLIENAVKGCVQVPPGAEELHPQALDLIRRILVSAPGQRCKLPDIMAHPWFQEKLPQGALLLNAAYLAIEHPVGELRQTPEEVHSIITSALANSPQPEGSETTSVGPKPEVPSVSDASRPHPQTQPPLSPMGTQQALPPVQLQTQNSVGFPPGSPLTLQGPMQALGPGAADAPLLARQGHSPPPPPLVGPVAPGLAPPQLQHQPPPFQAHHQHLHPSPTATEHSPPQHQPQQPYRHMLPQHAVHPQLAQHAPTGPPHPHPQPQQPQLGPMGTVPLRPTSSQSMAMLVDLGGLPLQTGSAPTSSSSHTHVAGAAGPGAVALADLHRHNPSAPHAPQDPALLPAAVPGSPMMAHGEVRLPSRGGGGYGAAFPPPAAGAAASSSAFAADPPGPPLGGPPAELGAASHGGGPGAMDVSGCILYDSSLLMALDLQAGD